MVRTNTGTRVNTANAPNTENKVLLIKLMCITIFEGEHGLKGKHDHVNLLTL